jgi:putative transcriptional regulator
MPAMPLTGQLLIAMPSLADPNFWRTVVLVGSHSPDEGAFGLVINRPSELALADVLQQLGRDEQPVRTSEVLSGGPVQPEQGFVLGEGQGDEDTDLGTEAFTISGRAELLESYAMGRLDGRFHLCLGYAGWAPGQLEQELEDNSWLVAPMSSDLVFGTPFDERWQEALASIGVDPGTLVDVGSSAPS